MKVETTQGIVRTNSLSATGKIRSSKKSYSKRAKKYMERHAAVFGILSSINKNEIESIQAVTKRLLSTDK